MAQEDTIMKTTQTKKKQWQPCDDCGTRRAVMVGRDAWGDVIQLCTECARHRAEYRCYPDGKGV